MASRTRAALPSLINNPEKVQLADFTFRSGERFLYEYDLYDSWEHDVRLEKMLPWNPHRLYPVCTGGNRLAPPEDFGGARVYIGYGQDTRKIGTWRQRLARPARASPDVSTKRSSRVANMLFAGCGFGRLAKY